MPAGDVAVVGREGGGADSQQPEPRGHALGQGIVGGSEDFSFRGVGTGVQELQGTVPRRAVEATVSARLASDVTQCVQDSERSRDTVHPGGSQHVGLTAPLRSSSVCRTPGRSCLCAPHAQMFATLDSNTGKPGINI